MVDDIRFLTAADRPTPDAAGGKASALASFATRLDNDRALAGVYIPDWFAVPAGMAAPDDAVRAAARRLASSTPDAARLAVRSSAADEDGRAHSHAGQFESVLNVRPDDVPAALAAVRASALGEGVRAYRARRGVADTPVRMAVLVQRMVDPAWAGVAFGRHPTDPASRLFPVNAVRGLADRLVSGAENGVAFLLDADGRAFAADGSGPVDPLPPDPARRMVAAVLRAAHDHFGTPMDLEWAWRDGRLAVLQLRPVTVGPATDKSPRIVWDNSNIVESYPGIVSPLTFSFARHVYSHVYRELARLLGVPDATLARHEDALRHLLGYLRGRVYYHLPNWYRLLSLFPGFGANRKFMEQMMGVREPLPDDVLREIDAERPRGFRARWRERLGVARVGWGLFVGQIRVDARVRAFQQRFDAALAPTDGPLDDWPAARLADAYRRLEARLLKAWDTPLLNDFLCMVWFGLSRRALVKRLGDAGAAYHNEVLVGQDGLISAEPAKRLRAFAETARGEIGDDPARMDAFTDALVSGDPARVHAALADAPRAAALLDAYVARFNDRCLEELKLESATLQDDPAPLWSAAAQILRGLRAPAEHIPPPSLNALGLRGVLARRWIGYALAHAKARVRDRENLRFERTRLFGRIRRILRAIGRRWTESGWLDGEGDVFFLEVGEILGLIEGEATTTTPDGLRALVALRRREYNVHRRMAPPPRRFVTTGGVAASLRKQFGDVDARPRATPAGASASASRVERTRAGVGCCPGLVRGRARVVDDPRRAALAPGDILVAAQTDPGWIALMAGAAGMVVERGSLLSHSAIVARELGIPTVVGVDGATAWIADGDRVELDGALGRVTILAD